MPLTDEKRCLVGGRFLSSEIVSLLPLFVKNKRVSRGKKIKNINASMNFLSLVITSMVLERISGNLLSLLK